MGFADRGLDGLKNGFAVSPDTSLGRSVLQPLLQLGDQEGKLDLVEESIAKRIDESQTGRASIFAVWQQLFGQVLIVKNLILNFA